jgi:hypothetical protein
MERSPCSPRTRGLRGPRAPSPICSPTDLVLNLFFGGKYWPTTLLRAGAALCITFALVGLWLIVFVGRAFQLQNSTVVQKRVELLRIVSEGSPGEVVLYDAHSPRFYELAQPGDIIRISFSGYAELLRDGHLIKRDVAPGLLIVVFMCMGAFFPTIVFVRPETIRRHRALRICVAVVELLIVGGFLFSFLS